MYDLASVQVLKEPQGTLFGRNSTSGAVLLVPQAPTDQLGGYASVELGNYNLHSIEAGINLPITDNLQIRLSGRGYAHDGYTRDVTSGLRYDDADNYSLRLGVKATFGRFSNLFFMNNFHSNENGSAFKVYNVRPVILGHPVSDIPVAAAAYQEFLASQNEPFHSVRTSIPKNANQTRTWGIENTTTYALTDDISLKNIFGYRHVNADNPFDYDGTSTFAYGGHIVTHEKQVSDELQLTGTAFDKHLDFIGGAYYFRESGDETQTTTLNFQPYLSQASVGSSDVVNQSKSLFGQGTLHVPGFEALSFTAGIRYTWDKRTFGRSATVNGVCAVVDANTGGKPINPECRRDARYTHGEPTYTLGVDWKIAPDKLLYFVTRKGYRSGGFNPRAYVPAQFIPFQPESVTDYEIGIKADWHTPIGHFRTNIDGYYQDYKDIQRTQTTVVNGLLVTNVVNAATARVKGIEADVTWTPVRWIELHGYYSYTDAGYKKWQVPIAGGGFQDRSNFDFANTPRNSGGGSVTVLHDLSTGAGQLALTVDGYAQSHMQTSDDNVLPEGIIQGYKLFNGRVEWRDVLGKPVTLGAFIRNLTKEKYYTSGVTVAGAGLGYTVRTIGAPRTFGFTGRVDF